MIEPVAFTASALPFVFILGLRHGLDPDHVAVIDSLTFRAAEENPRYAPWTGSLFAIGHSLSVTAVAFAASLLASRWSTPPSILATADWLVIGLLVLVGVLNLRSLLRPEPYRPQGWRLRLLPRRFGDSGRPGGAFAIGLTFGLVFDTATQAAAWGAAATAAGGLGAAMAVSMAFAAGMILVDTADSFTVALLLRRGRAKGSLVRYRRGVGWLIVALSFGAAAWAVASRLADVAASDTVFTAIGIAMAILVVAALVVGRIRLAAQS